MMKHGWVLVLVGVETALVANLLFVPTGHQFPAGLGVFVAVGVAGAIYRRFRPKTVNWTGDSAPSFLIWVCASTVCLVAADILLLLLGVRGHQAAWMQIEMWPALLLGLAFDRWCFRRRRATAPELPT